MKRLYPGSDDIIPALNIESSSVRSWTPDSDGSGSPLHEQYRALSRQSVDRRQFNKFLLASLGAAGIPAGLAGCGKQPAEEIVPYVDAPENVVPGRPIYYSSVFTRQGYGYGVLVESHQGRPTKVEGNPDHPATLGASDVFMQAELLNLYDPDRSRGMTRNGEHSGLDELLQELARERHQWTDRSGAGLHILTPPLTSPSLAAQMQTLLTRFPKAKWHQWQPINHDHALAGSRMAFGENLSSNYRLQAADVVVQLDGDLLSELPGSLAYARDFSRRRDPRQAMSRVYAIESKPGLIGAMADHRLALRADRIETLTRALVAQISGNDRLLSRRELSGIDNSALDWLDACTEDLQAARGRSLIVPGANQPATVHALSHWLNDYLGNAGNTITYREHVMQRPELLVNSLQTLVEAMADDRVKSLITIDCDPAFDAPADFRFAERMRRVPFTVHVGTYTDATARLSRWHLPLSHMLESWGDARAFDGTEAIQQPLISPLYDSVSPHSMVGYITDAAWQPDYHWVRRYWKQQLPQDNPDRAWRAMLIEGQRPDSAAAPVAPSPREILPEELPASPVVSGPLLQFAPDSRLGDGRYANNAWMLELPDPLTKLTWGNALWMSPALAARHALANGDVVAVACDSVETVELPVWIMPEHAGDAVTLPLGYGREIKGNDEEAAVNRNIGVNGYPLRRADNLYWRGSVSLRKTGRTEAMAVTQHHASMEGRDPVIAMTLSGYRQYTGLPPGSEHASQAAPSLFPEPDPPPFDHRGGYDWAMSIDLNSCIGCGACTVACQAENNIPVVGREQVLQGRDMHWIRIDRYYQPEGDGQKRAGGQMKTLFQPVPCQHCENAPCEYVCPVGATVHDSEGLNVMVYNRCIGTRDCSQNCPYKVRRFNFLEYNYGKPDTAALAPLRNPDVTVRSRGVMEKCTYCVQRISRARRDAKKDGRSIRDGEVVTACQQACPTRAITFGNINDMDSKISKAKRHPLDYTLLAELNTRPRTSYVARVSNRHPIDQDGKQHDRKAQDDG